MGISHDLLANIASQLTSANGNWQKVTFTKPESSEPDREYDTIKRTEDDGERGLDKSGVSLFNDDQRQMDENDVTGTLTALDDENDLYEVLQEAWLGATYENNENVKTDEVDGHKVVYNDVNGNGVYDEGDMMLQQYRTSKNGDLDEAYMTNYDINGDGIIDENDMADTDNDGVPDTVRPDYYKTVVDEAGKAFILKTGYNDNDDSYKTSLFKRAPIENEQDGGDNTQGGSNNPSIIININ